MRTILATLLFTATLPAIPARGAVVQSIPAVTEKAASSFRFAIPAPDRTQPSPAPAPAHRPAKKKAGFLAAAGLAVLSLLVLAAGLALLRAFRQR
jgi:hypothetical protein